MKKSSKLTLEKRGVLTAGRAINASGTRVHADKRQPPRSAQKQRLKRELQLETARNRGPFPFFRQIVFGSFPYVWKTTWITLQGIWISRRWQRVE